MTELQETELKASIAGKLFPDRFPSVSGKMFACLGALLGVKFTSPRIASIVASSDGFLMGRMEGEIGFNDFIGAFEDFKRNTLGMADAAGDLTSAEREFLETLLLRVESGIETKSTETSYELALDTLGRPNN